MNILDFANNDNELGNVYRDGEEYVIEINCWNNTKVVFKTVDCRYIIHFIELTDEIGDIIIDGNLYKFMTLDGPDGEETILEIEAKRMIQINN